MKLLCMPCWNEDLGGEAYNVILEKESGEFKKTKLSMGLDFDPYVSYVISIEDGVLSLRKTIHNEYSPNEYVDLVVDGVAAKDSLNEIITVLEKLGTKFRELSKRQAEIERREKWLHSSIYETNIDGWEW